MIRSDGLGTVSSKKREGGGLCGGGATIVDKRGVDVGRTAI